MFPTLWYSGKQNLLLLLELLSNFEGNLESLGNEISRGKGKPLGQRDVGDAVRLVNLDPDKILSLRSVLNVVAIDKLAKAFRT